MTEKAEKLLSRGYGVPGVRDRADIAERLKEMYEDSGRPDEARQFGEQARRLRHEPRSAQPPGRRRHPGTSRERSRWNLIDAPTAALMAERDAFLVPTLVTCDAMERRGAELGLAPVAQSKNREVLDAGRTAIRLAREAGVRIGFGTDLMGALDDEQLHGLRLQAEG